MKKLNFSNFLLILIGLAYLLCGAKTGVTFFPVFVLGAGLFLWTLIRGRSQNVPLSVLIPFGIFFLWPWTALLTGAPLAEFLFIYSRLVLYFMMAIWVVQVGDEPLQGRFEWLLIGMAFGESVAIIGVKVMGGAVQTAGLLANSLHNGILIPVGLAALLSKFQTGSFTVRKAVGALLVSVVFVLALIFLRSRAGLLCVLALGVLFYTRKMVWVLGTFALVLAVWAVIRQGMFFADLELDAFTRKSTFARLGIWETAIRAVLDRPITGWGLGNFEAAYSRHQMPSAHWLHFGNSTQFAHNGLLQVAVATGIPGLGIFIWGLVALGRQIKPALRREKGLVGIVVVFIITSLFNYSLFLPLNGLIFSAAVGFLVSKSLPFHSRVKTVNLAAYWRVPAVLIALLSLFLLSFGASQFFEKRGRVEMAAKLCPLRSEAWYLLGIQSLGRDANQGIKFIDQAISWNPQNSYYWQRRALVGAHFQPDNVEANEAAFDRAQALNPFHAPFYIQEGFYRLSRGNYEAAMNLFNQAETLEPNATLPKFGQAIIWARSNKRDMSDLKIQSIRVLMAKKLDLENDPISGLQHQANFSNPYARFMFNVTNQQLEALQSEGSPSAQNN